ncbi:META domain-containing protein [Nocardia sp. CA2R105]|uniref:META domain-containing protein n=1 Tax=Nocardia coffeae TaxID=2873381 RepID=UPI001CA79383|nr:META domain-containing protein [Nocardia coffeae]MBY8859647.1 META domain-containing protein [Nocardia coffeae]
MSAPARSQSTRRAGRAATFLWVPVLLVCALLPACSSDSGPAPTPMGHTYISTGVRGTPIPGGGPLTLSFQDGRVSADSGCNSSGGPATFDGSVLRVSRMATTMMACVGDKSGADGWQTALLQSAPKWSLSGSTLTLTGHDVTVTLQDKRVLHPDLPLTGTAWVVTTLLRQEGQVRSQALDAARPTLTIAADGQVSGSAGCNRMTGTAEISGSNVTFHLGTTRMMCAPDVMQIEQQVLEALTGATEATVDSDTLTIRNRANDTGLILRSE